MKPRTQLIVTLVLVVLSFLLARWYVGLALEDARHPVNRRRVASQAPATDPTPATATARTEPSDTSGQDPTVQRLDQVLDGVRALADNPGQVPVLLPTAVTSLKSIDENTLYGRPGIDTSVDRMRTVLDGLDPSVRAQLEPEITRLLRPFTPPEPDDRPVGESAEEEG